MNYKRYVSHVDVLIICGRSSSLAKHPFDSVFRRDMIFKRCFFVCRSLNILVTCQITSGIIKSIKKIIKKLDLGYKLVYDQTVI